MKTNKKKIKQIISKVIIQPNKTQAYTLYPDTCYLGELQKVTSTQSVHGLENL